MRLRLLAAVFAISLAATAQTPMTLAELYSFVQSSQQFIKEGKMTDRELAGFLSKSKLSERLDDRSVELLQGLGIGPKTLEALQRLRDQSKTLTAGGPMEPPGPPPQAPPPSSVEQAAIIDHAREYALSYSRQLPDFICTQVTRRFGALAPGTRGGGRADSEPSFQLLDTLTSRVSYFEEKEDKKLVLINNSLTAQDYKTLGGSTSTGEFGSLLRQVFEYGSQARFEWDHWGTLRSHYAMVFAYHVDQAHSQWHIEFDRRMDIVPAYHGLVYVDNKTREILRVTLVAEGIPADFPVKSAETTLDYNYQDISGHTFLLPYTARTLMAAEGYLTRNDEEFRIYRKYQVESELKFDDATPPPLPEEEKKEQPAAPPAKKKK
jgi:hypothetical protein